MSRKPLEAETGGKLDKKAASRVAASGWQCWALAAHLLWLLDLPLRSIQYCKEYWLRLRVNRQNSVICSATRGITSLWPLFAAYQHHVLPSSSSFTSSAPAVAAQVLEAFVSTTATSFLQFQITCTSPTEIRRLQQTAGLETSSQGLHAAYALSSCMAYRRETSLPAPTCHISQNKPAEEPEDDVKEAEILGDDEEM